MRTTWKSACEFSAAKILIIQLTCGIVDHMKSAHVSNLQQSLILLGVHPLSGLLFSALLVHFHSSHSLVLFPVCILCLILVSALLLHVQHVLLCGRSVLDLPQQWNEDHVHV